MEVKDEIEFWMFHKLLGNLSIFYFKVQIQDLLKIKFYPCLKNSINATCHGRNFVLRWVMEMEMRLLELLKILPGICCGTKYVNN